MPLFVLSVLGCDMWLIVTGSRFASGRPRVIIYIVQLNLKIPLTSSSNEALGTFLNPPSKAVSRQQRLSLTKEVLR